MYGAEHELPPTWAVAHADVRGAASAGHELAVQEVARSILRHRSAARLPSIVEYQERLGVGSGTVQKAFHILEESGAATTEPRGHLGRFVVSITPAGPGPWPALASSTPS